MKNQQSNQQRKNEPVAKFKIWPLSAAIWEQRTNDGDVFYNVTIQRSYRDGEGEYKSSQSFGKDDLLTLGKLADRAHSWIVDQEEKNHAEAQR